MSELVARVRAALEKIPHRADCNSLADLPDPWRCDCDREERVVERVAAALRAAWRFNPYSRNESEVLRALSVSPPENRRNPT